MSIKTLRFEGIKKRATKFKKLSEEFSLNQEFSIDQEVEKFLNKDHLAPIIGTICDQEITTEHAWTFPYWLHNKLNGKFSAQSIYKLGTKKIEKLLSLFLEDKWPSGMADKKRKNYLKNISRYIIKTCELIINVYDNDADNMFKNGKFTAPEIYFILRSLPGIGPKKASMIARDFVKAEGPWYKGIQDRLEKKGIKFKVERKNLTEVPVDVHVVKIFGRVMGEFRKTPSRDKFLDYWPDIQNFAKLAFPSFPGKIDEILWLVGRQYCYESEPDCKNCPLKDIPCEYAKRKGL